MFVTESVVVGAMSRSECVLTWAMRCRIFSFAPSSPLRFSSLFFFNDPAPTEIYPLPLHDALPIFPADSTYAQQWRLGATHAGETVTIDLVSDVFDAYVFLLGPGLERERPQDDDSGGSCNARLTARLPQTEIGRAHV